MSATDLAAQLGVSIPTLHRMLQEHQGSIVVTGKARRTRYALRRPLRGDMSEMPLYEVGVDGSANLFTKLALVQPQGTQMDLRATDWPVPEESRDGWWDGLPYPIYDMRPQGFMGRHFARAEHRHLGVSNNPDEWADDDVAYVLSRVGSDVGGNLILGDLAYEHWQAAKLAMGEPLASRAVTKAYARLAEQAITSGVAGSSAAGEFPKFTARRELKGSATQHVLVKFSGSDASPTVARWSDLLVCEHLALEVAATLPGIASASSRILASAGRTFLEVERFDRHGPFGRSALVSLQAAAAALAGGGAADWVKLARPLDSAGLLGEGDLQRIEYLWWFGRLIANADMHAGNLSFRPGEGVLHLAPTYDMLPMFYAPLAGGEVPARQFEPPTPLPPQRAIWSAACTAASQFWTLASADSRITLAFRAICRANAERLAHVGQRA